MRPSKTTVGFLAFVSPLLLATSCLSCLSAGLAAVPGCQAPANAVGQPQGGNSAAPASWPANLILAGTPGQTCTVPLGTTAKNILEKAKLWHPYNQKYELRAIKNMRSEQGEREVKIQAFYMSKNLVTNEQYMVFVKATGHRFPFHWWKDGKNKHYQKTLTKVRKAYPDLNPGDRKNAPLYYWEDFWKSESLPFAIPEGLEQHPVQNVSYYDAFAFAAWAGMRLPLEEEWTFAANGGERKEFLIGKEWDPTFPAQLGMENSRDIKLKAVGLLGDLATGPFGHQDMVGQLWEWTGEIGYGPQNGLDAFKREDRILRKDKKLGSRINEAVSFRPGWCIAKGGSYYSFANKDFVQIRINCRAPLAPEQTLEGVGFRVAKTERPAFDMSLSRLKRDRPVYLTGSKEPNLRDQVGIERYDLENGGQLIVDYHALSFLPISYLTLRKNPTSVRLGEQSQKRPLELGVLITTEEIREPALSKGVYTVYLRQAGRPKELTTALREGVREMIKLRKAEEEAKKAAEKAKKNGRKQKPKKETKKKNGKNPAKKRPEKKKSGVEWRVTIKRYGFTPDDMVKGAEKIQHIFLRHTGIKKDEPKLFKVDTQQSMLIYRNKDGKYIAAVPTKHRILIHSKSLGNRENQARIDWVEKPGSEAGASTTKQRLAFTFYVPTIQKERDKWEEKKSARVSPFTFQLELTKDWR